MPREWAVPKIWRPEELVAVLATGQSLKREDIQKVEAAGAHIIVINDAYRMVPEAEVLYAADGEWWNYHGPLGAFKFPGLKVTMSITCKSDDVMLLKSGDIQGFDKRPTHMATCGNSGYQGIHLAMHFGSRNIVLLGFDFKGTHFFGEHPQKIKRPSNFMRCMAQMTASAPVLAKMGARIINCSPDSALTCFKSMRLDDALASLSADTRSTILSA